MIEALKTTIKSYSSFEVIDMEEVDLTIASIVQKRYCLKIDHFVDLFEKVFNLLYESMKDSGRNKKEKVKDDRE